MILYQLSHILKTFDHRRVLDIESLTIHEKGIYGVVGPNGAGKTTLLNILGFLDPPTSGNIRFRDKPVPFSSTAMQRLRKSVVMVNQRPLLFSQSVTNNILFGLKIRKIPAHARKRIVRAALTRVGMLHLSDARAATLSGGETQRIAIARAIALSPDVMLCDEPTANVDAENQIVVIDLLKEINRTCHTTLIFTTHDRRTAAALTDTVFHMDGGKISHTPYENLFFARLRRDDCTAVAIIRNTRGHDDLIVPITDRIVALMPSGDHCMVFFSGPSVVMSEAMPSL